MSDWVHSADTIDLETRMGKVKPSPVGPITTSVLTAPSSTGVTVSETSALAVSAVFAAVRVISEAIGTLPLNVYRKDGQKRLRYAHANHSEGQRHDSDVLRRGFMR